MSGALLRLVFVCGPRLDEDWGMTTRKYHVAYIMSPRCDDIQRHAMSLPPKTLYVQPLQELLLQGCEQMRNYKFVVWAMISASACQKSRETFFMTVSALIFGSMMPVPKR